MGTCRGKNKQDRLYKFKKSVVEGRNLWPEDGLVADLCESLDPWFSSSPSLGAFRPQILNETLGGSRVSSHKSLMSGSGSPKVILSRRQFFPF